MTVFKLDYDFCGKRLLKVIRDRAFVFRFLKINIYRVEVYKTAHGWHVYYTTRRKFPDIEIAFIQLLLGSDYKREMFNFQRITKKFNISRWNTLFKRKYIDKKLVSEEIFNKKINQKVEQILESKGVFKSKNTPNKNI